MSDVLTLVIAGAALVVSGLALHWAKVSAKASELSADVAARAEAARVEAVAAAAVTWELRRAGPDEVVARNRGPQSAYDVHVWTSSTLPNGPPVGFPQRDEMLVDTDYVFDVALQERLPEPWAEVRWKVDPADTEWRTWKRPLPPKPRPTRPSVARITR